MKSQKETHTLRQVGLTGSPIEPIKIPDSNGYLVYSGLLNVIDDSNPEISKHVHDAAISSLNCSGLQGVFYDSDEKHKQVIRPSEMYTITLGITDPEDEEIFKSLLDALMFDGEIQLADGTFAIDQLESDNTTHEEILEEASQAIPYGIAMDFETCTSIREAGDVTTAFPHRWTVFDSLLGKWNESCSDPSCELAVDREAVLKHVYEQPDVRSLQTHSVLVSRGNEDGEVRNIQRQGFSGRCVYKFKDATESLTNAITALGMFAEYSGVGGAVARGPGTVSTEVME